MSSESPIEFYCVICGASLAVAAEHEGALVECPACARSVPVPGRMRHHSGSNFLPAFNPQILSVDLTFLCPGCDRRLLTDARMEGVHFQCPKCGAEGEVPAWSGEGREERRGVTVALSADEIDFLSSEIPAAVLRGAATLSPG